MVDREQHPLALVNRPNKAKFGTEAASMAMLTVYCSP
jgi:hypothetical protein